jgi:hypothetical protein
VGFRIPGRATSDVTHIYLHFNKNTPATFPLLGQIWHKPKTGKRVITCQSGLSLAHREVSCQNLIILDSGRKGRTWMDLAAKNGSLRLG